MKKIPLAALALLLFVLAYQDLDQSAAQGQAQKSLPAAAPSMEKQMQTMNEMMVKHLGKKDAQYERRFIDMMIPHHQGAIMMAEHAMQNANRPELKKMAEEIILAQKKEIAQLKQWRKDWYPE